MNGTDGTNGTNGTNGTDGVDGSQGPPGPVGPAGPTGPTGPAGSSVDQEPPPLGALGSTVMYMTVPNVTGPVLTKGYAGKFLLGAFGMSSPSETSPSWTLSARIKSDSKGAPELHQLTASATHIPTITFEYALPLTAASPKSRNLDLTFNDVVISSDQSDAATAAAPTTTLTFTFTKFAFYNHATNHSGSWDLTRGQGTFADVSKLQYIFGAKATNYVTISSFSAFQDGFGDVGASTVTLPVLASGEVILMSMLASLEKTPFPVALVSLNAGASLKGALVAEYQRYTFNQVQLGEVSVYGVTGKIAFSARSAHWRTGRDTQDYTPPEAEEPTDVAPPDPVDSEADVAAPDDGAAGASGAQGDAGTDADAGT